MKHYNDIEVIGNVEAQKLKKKNGTSNQFLKANGSVDGGPILPTELVNDISFRERIEEDGGLYESSECLNNSLNKVGVILAGENVIHIHNNKSVLDKLNENTQGKPTYKINGVDEIISQRTITNSLTSTNQTTSLSAYAGKSLKDNIDNYKAETTNIDDIPDWSTIMENNLNF